MLGDYIVAFASALASRRLQHVRAPRKRRKPGTPRPQLDRGVYTHPVARTRHTADASAKGESERAQLHIHSGIENVADAFGE